MLGSVVISAMKTIWRLVTGDALQGLVLGPALLNICINDLEDGTEDTLGKFAVDTNPGGTSNFASWQRRQEHPGPK